MSSSAIAWAFRQPLRGNAKLLLLTLADCADDYNRTSPHIRRLELETGLGRHTVIRLLAHLEDEGVVQVERTPGRPCVYILQGAPERIPPATTPPRDRAAVRPTSVQNGTGAILAPVAERHGGGANLAREGCQDGTGGGANLAPVRAETSSFLSTFSEVREEQERELDSQSVVDATELADVAPGGAAPSVSRSVVSTGVRLPKPWTLPRSWGVWAVEQGLAEAEVRQIAEDFADHWHAAPGARGRKADWQATWRRWIRKEIDDRRPRLNGVEAQRERNRRADAQRTPVWQEQGFPSFDAWQESITNRPPEYLGVPAPARAGAA